MDDCPIWHVGDKARCINNTDFKFHKTGHYLSSDED
jgi:hypothetical protein